MCSGLFHTRHCSMMFLNFKIWSTHPCPFLKSVCSWVSLVSITASFSHQHSAEDLRWYGQKYDASPVFTVLQASLFGDSCLVILYTTLISPLAAAYSALPAIISTKAFLSFLTLFLSYLFLVLWTSCTCFWSQSDSRWGYWPLTVFFPTFLRSTRCQQLFVALCSVVSRHQIVITVGICTMIKLWHLGETHQYLLIKLWSI